MPPGHYSNATNFLPYLTLIFCFIGESDIHALELESTPTDDLLSTPLRDYKLSRFNRATDLAESDRKGSADFLTSEKKHQPPNSLWLEACSTSAPLPGAEMEKEGIE